MPILRRGLALIREAATDFAANEAITRSAALAFYAALSMAPLVILLLWLAAFFGSTMQDAWLQQLSALIGAEGGKALEMIVQNAQSRPRLQGIAGLVGIATLAFGASAVFGELQAVLDRIWHVQAKPGLGVWTWVRKRVASFGMLLSVFFLLLISTALSAVLNAVSTRMFGAPESMLAEALHFALSFLVFGASFALLYRYLPDVRIHWRDVWVGGFVTALLFVAGKFAVGLYLGRASVGSAYGAAGSLIVLLVWAYYSSIIFLFGAELTRSIAQEQGRDIEPDTHAVRIEAPARPDAGSPVQRQRRRHRS